MFSLFSPLIYNIVSLANNCENVADFSIYQQAIYDSFALANPNPFLTIRNVHILQDHFDPVFLLAGPWAALFNYSPYSLLVFEWLFLAATLGVLIYYSQDIKTVLLWSFLLLWNRGIIHAVGYPIHPTTWSMLPITLMIIAIKEKRERLFWISSLSLLFFKEVFPIAILGLSGGFFLTRHYKKGSILLAVSLLFCLFNFYGRTHLLEGESLNYAASIWKPWRDNFWEQFSRFPIKSLLMKDLVTGALAFCLIVAKKSFKQEEFLLLAFWLPLFLIHTIAIKFGHQYGVLIYWPLMLLLWKKNFLFKDKWVVLSLIIACIHTAFGTHTKNYFYIFKQKIRNHCEISQTKRKSIKKVQSLVFQIPISNTLLSTGGNIPVMLRPGTKIYHLKGASPPLKQYDYLLLGRKEDFYPLNKKELEQIWNNCLKRPPSDILFVDDYHLLAKGPVSSECL